MLSAKMWLDAKLVGLWPLIWHFGTGGIVIIACLAFYFAAPVWLLPGLRKLCLWIAAVFAVAMVSYGIGISNEHSRMAEQSVVLVHNAVETSNRARDEAEAEVARNPLPVGADPADCVPVVRPAAPVLRPRWVRAPTVTAQPWNRDQASPAPKRAVRPVAKHPVLQ